MHHRFLSGQWRIELDLATGDTILLDGEQFIASTKEFPDGTLREIRLENGTAWRRCLPSGEWTGVAGEYFGRRFDEIEFYAEECDDDAGQFFGCLIVNVIAYRVQYLDFNV